MIFFTPLLMRWGGGFNPQQFPCLRSSYLYGVSITYWSISVGLHCISDICTPPLRGVKTPNPVERRHPPPPPTRLSVIFPFFKMIFNVNLRLTHAYTPSPPPPPPKHLSVPPNFKFLVITLRPISMTLRHTLVRTFFVLFRFFASCTSSQSCTYYT